MSRVFLAREPALARDVVIKVLPPDLVSTTSLQRFTREIRVTARLQHPHILPVISAGGDEDLRYYVAPFIRGESLRARLASGEPLAFVEAVRVGDELLTAVAFAHERGVIHRDIKPGNILLSEGHAILADFGIASLIEVEAPADHHDQVTGSTLDSARIYVAPEQPRDEQRDLFATAVVIHEMVVGAPGVAGLSAASIATAVRARHPRAPMSDVRKLAAILARALAVAPTARFQSANELRVAIHSIGRGSRRPVLAGVGVGSVAAMLALSVFALRPPGPPESPVTAPAPVLQESTKVVAIPATVASQQGAEATETSLGMKPDVAPLNLADSAAFLFRQGDLSAAVSMYQSAVREDATNARAQLGVAVTLGMVANIADQEAVRVAAERALAAKPKLDAHDQAIAEGFIAMVDRRFPDACAAFERAREARASVEAWMGLGECRLRDDAIVFDSAGAPAFRSGYASAFNAFANAARAAAPSTPALIYRRLTQSVPQTSADVRMGRTPDNRVFAGNWRIIGDTLGFVVGQSGVPRALSPETFVAAGEAAKVGRDMLRPILLAWAKQSPHESGAHEMLAMVLENTGVIDEMGDDRVSALTAIARARKLERNPGVSLRLAASHARLMLRARQYEQLADLADSLLAANTSEEAFDAEYLMPLALFTGRIDRATAMLSRVSGTSNRAVRGADGRAVPLPGTVIRERAEFVIRASIGLCDANVKSAPARLIQVLDAAFPAGVPRGVESSFMERGVLFALPCLGPSVVAMMREPGRSLPMWARAFNPADTAFPAEYAARERLRPPMNMGAETGVDGIIVDALVKVAMKDSVGALRTLTLSLDRIPIIGRGLLSSEWAVGSTVRGMALAAELAAALGERETAQRWSSAIVTLWRNADPALQPQVERLRAIARTTSDESRRE